MGSNLSFLRSKYGINFQSHNLAHCIKVSTTVEQLYSQSNCLIEQLRFLLRSRCNEYVINGFKYDEITELIREVACYLLYYNINIYLYCYCISIIYYIITVTIVSFYSCIKLNTFCV